jgi:hypothetical protein
MLNGNVLKIPHQAINITEEMNKSGCWQSLEPNAATPLIKVSSSSSKWEIINIIFLADVELQPSSVRGGEDLTAALN